MGVKNVQIVLNNPSGVYYSGDVIRGQVKVTVEGEKEVKARAVNIRLQGKAYCHWHTGSGKDRKDYSGSLIVQQLERTLAGAYYSTSVLSNAGANATFNRAPGDGDIYIPCTSSDNIGHFILRVMDYDWGKRDDLLGEVVVDLNSLIRKGGEQTFYLSRKGAPVSLNNNQSSVTLSAGIIITETGQSLCKVIIYQANNLRKADMWGKNDIYVQMYPPPDNVDESKALPGPAKRIDAPSSTELRAGDASYIRWSLYANVNFALWKDPSTRQGITVIAMRPLPTPQLLIPAYSEQPETLAYGCDCCGCIKLFGRGDIRADFRIERLTFVPGDIIPLTGNIHNNTSGPLSVKISLRRYFRLRAGGGAQHSGYTDSCLSQFSMEAQSATDNLFQGALSQKIPIVQPSFYGVISWNGLQKATSSWYYNPVTWCYSIVISCSCIGIGATSFEKKFPVLIAASPVYVDKLPSPGSVPVRNIDQRQSTNNANQVVPDDTALVLSNPWLLSQWSICDNQKCDIAPSPLTEIKGSKVVPIGVPHNITDPVEDKYALETPKQFQPMVLEWNNVDLSTNTDSSAKIDSPREDSVADLMQILDNSSFDIKKTLAEYLIKNRVFAAEITPEQVEVILNKTKFAFEKPGVAATLANSMPNLKCQHIVAAMETVSSVFKRDIAKAMYGCVNDPENVQIILDKLGSFEQAQFKNTNSF